MTRPYQDKRWFRIPSSTRTRWMCAIHVAIAVSGCVAGHPETGGETNWLEACRKDPECDAGAASNPQPPGTHSAGTETTPDAGAAEPVQLTRVQFENAQVTPAEARTVDPSGGAWRVIEVPTLSNEPSVVRTPSGWLALSDDTLGDGKAILGYRSALYESVDGVHWELIPVAESDDVALTSLAYGNGHYVMTSRAVGAKVSFWSSTDAREWTVADQGVASTDEYRNVVFENGKFFALGMRYVGISEDGVNWEHVPVGNVQASDVAYGNGKYVLVGSGPMQVSPDGTSWESVEVPCELPGACITDPSGGVHQGYYTSVVFALGRFFAGQLSSSDGSVWDTGPWSSQGASPQTFILDRFIGSLGRDLQLEVWTTDVAPLPLRVVRPSEFGQTAAGRPVTSIGVLSADELPQEVDVDFEDGLTCETADCVLIGSRLLLVPPEGHAPLPDRIARDAEGLPLLSEDCPVSSTVFCDDYAERVGCTCDDEAPTEPEACGDVGKYVCEGAFTARATEWALDEVAHAGCRCNYLDPNEPESFGESCNDADATCVAPLQCLSIPGEGILPSPSLICTASCSTKDDCPTWTATGFCAGEVRLQCLDGACQPRGCNP